MTVLGPVLIIVGGVLAIAAYLLVEVVRTVPALLALLGTVVLYLLPVVLLALAVAALK